VKDAVKDALEKLRDPTQRDWYAQRCSQAPKHQAWLDEIAERVGGSVWKPRKVSNDPRPRFSSSITMPKYENGNFIVEYNATIEASSIVDVFDVRYYASIVNCGPERGWVNPFLDVGSSVPFVSSLAGVEREIVPELERRGWLRMSREEAEKRVPEMGILFGVLRLDINGWLDDSNPMPPPDDSSIRSHRDTLDKLYRDGAARIRKLAATTPSWIASLEQIFGHAGRVDRLAPDVYPSMSWTVDFGVVENGNFRARFFSDVHVSKLAPVWYYSDRFVIAHDNPEATSRELADWGNWEIGYVQAQTAMISEVRKTFATLGFAELDSYELPFPVASPIGDGFVPFGELAFRDPLHVGAPAPRVEEEGIDRFVKPRIGHLGSER
jgi:hypothetical protein